MKTMTAFETQPQRPDFLRLDQVRRITGDTPAYMSECGTIHPVNSMDDVQESVNEGFCFDAWGYIDLQAGVGSIEWGVANCDWDWDNYNTHTGTPVEYIHNTVANLRQLYPTIKWYLFGIIEKKKNEKIYNGETLALTVFN